MHFNVGKVLLGVFLLFIVADVSVGATLDYPTLQSAVVKIRATKQSGPGSGALIKIDGRRGYILTAYHVIQKAVDSDLEKVEVKFFRKIGKFDGIIKREWVETRADLAIIVVEDVPVQSAVQIGSSEDLQIQDAVIAIGHPSGSSWSVTEGKVSNFEGRDILFSGNYVAEGNSGGPLLNARGEMVGLNIEKRGVFGIARQMDVIKPIIRLWVELVTPPPPTEIRGKDGKEMLLVPEGSFPMGSDDGDKDERPMHRVWVDDFYMDKYEVTVGEYRKFVSAVGHRNLPHWVSKYSSGDNHPVVGVSWEDANSYCQWAGKRLPREAEWEKAARGTNGRQNPWGNEEVDGGRANYYGSIDGHKYTAPVGSYERGKSPYGIYDLAGNVWEWVEDWYDAGYYNRSLERNPVNNTKSRYHVLRGGGWNLKPAYFRAALRRRDVPGRRNKWIGVRCVDAVFASKY